MKVYGSCLYCFTAVQILEGLSECHGCHLGLVTYLFPTDSQIRGALRYRRTGAWFLEDNWVTS